MVKQGKYMLLTIDEFTDYLADKICDAWIKVKDIRFIYDFALSSYDDFNESNQNLEELKASTSGWYGIRTCDCGFDSDEMAVVADYYGGGCLTVSSISVDDEKDVVKGKLFAKLTYVFFNEVISAWKDDVILVEIRREKFETIFG